MVNVAFGTQVAWDLLTSAAQAEFDGGHYLLLVTAIAAHPGFSATDNYKYTGISNTINNNKITLPVDTSGYSLEFNGGGYRYECEYAGDDVFGSELSAVGDVSFHDFLISFNVEKGSSSNSFVYIQHSDINISFYKNEILGNGYGSGVQFYNILSATPGYVSVYQNKFIECDYGIRVYGDDPYNIDIENNTIYSSTINGIWCAAPLSGLSNYKNNNVSNSTSDDIASSGTDLGGNATSDGTGTSGYQNISPTDAMVNPSNGYYNPKSPLSATYSAPLISANNTYYDDNDITMSNAYAGAFGISFPQGRYYTPISANSEKVGHIGDFVQWIDLSNLPAETLAHMEADRGDLEIFNDDGTLRFSLHIVENSLNQAWFRAPITSADDTVYRLYYGNNGASQPDNVKYYGQYGVYPYSWVESWKLDDVSSGASNDIKGSTSNQIHGTGVNSPNSVSGAIGNGQSFNGTTQYVDINDDSKLNLLPRTDAFSFLYITKNDISIAAHISKADANPSDRNFYIFTISAETFFRIGDSQSTYPVVLNDDIYHMVVGTIPASSTGQKLYVDGTEITPSLNNGIGVGSASNSVNFASRTDGSTLYSGIIDNVCIIKEELTEYYLSSTYNNWMDNVNFYTIGDEVDTGGDNFINNIINYYRRRRI